MCMYESVKLPPFLLLLADSISLLRFDQYSLRFVHPESSFSAVSGNVPCTTVHLIKVVCLTALPLFLRSTLKNTRVRSVQKEISLIYK